MSKDLVKSEVSLDFASRTICISFPGDLQQIYISFLSLILGIALEEGKDINKNTSWTMDTYSNNRFRKESRQPKRKKIKFSITTNWQC